MKAAADGAEAVLWDSELKGFGVRVQRGGAKSYVLQYRAGGGRGAPLRKLTIGRHGSPWTPETARKEAKTLLGMIEDGADPAADKMARREAPTIGEAREIARQMRTTAAAILAMFLALTTAHAQQMQGGGATNVQAVVPITGVDEAALAPGPAPVRGAGDPCTRS